MSLQNKHDWTSTNASFLRTFLESETGQRLLFHVSENCPELLGSGDVNSILIRSGEVKGHSSSIAFILSLTVETPVSSERPEAYPDIDSDVHWNDNPIITPKPTTLKPTT